MRQIADEAGAMLLVDMAHIAGLVAGGAHPSPIPYADVVTCTTTKTLRGPRGGLILSRDSQWARQLQSAIFPGVQGSLHTNVIAAKAVCLGEALTEDFKKYAHSVVENARSLGRTLQNEGIALVSSGTDTHLLLLDFSNTGLSGQQVQDALDQVNITSNKNPVPYDVSKPADWSGLRLGTAAITTRGFAVPQMQQLGRIISGVIKACESDGDSKIQNQAKKEVAELCQQYPI